MATFKRAAQGLFHLLGGVEAVRYRNRDSVRILMYHRFGDPEPARIEQIEQQCAHLQRHYQVVSLSEAAERLAQGGSIPVNLVAITVDDGHRDFYTTAYPIFRRHGFPATLFLTTDYVDGKCWLWFDLIDYLFEQTDAARLEIAECSLALGSRENKLEAAERVKQIAVGMSNPGRLDLMARLPIALGVAVPERPTERWEPLSWEEVREMAQHGIEFGAHTRTHPILSSVTDASEMREEIEASKARVEQMLSKPALHFCYPSGLESDFTATAVECVRRAGFRTAVTAQPGMNEAGAPLFLLKRIGAEPWYSPDYFARRLAGFRAPK